MKRRSVLGLVMAALGVAGASVALAGSKEAVPVSKGQGDTMATAATGKIEKITKSDADWKKELTPEEYRVLREEGTERAFTGKYWNDAHDDKAVYLCAGCGLELFSGEHKFDSGTGWPSYWQPIKSENVETRVDKSFFTVRTEVHCARCGGHLGHVFEDGPKPTGLRYCINGVSLDKK